MVRSSKTVRNSKKSEGTRGLMAESHDDDDFATKTKKKKENVHKVAPFKKDSRQKSSKKEPAADTGLSRLPKKQQQKAARLSDHSDEEVEEIPIEQDDFISSDTSSYLYSPLPSQEASHSSIRMEQIPQSPNPQECNEFPDAAATSEPIENVCSHMKDFAHSELSLHAKEADTAEIASSIETPLLETKADSSLKRSRLFQGLKKLPRWKPPGPAGLKSSVDSTPSIGLRIGLSRRHILRPLHPASTVTSNLKQD